MNTFESFDWWWNYWERPTGWEAVYVLSIDILTCPSWSITAKRTDMNEALILLTCGVGPQWVLNKIYRSAGPVKWAMANVRETGPKVSLSVASDSKILSSRKGRRKWRVTLAWASLHFWLRAGGPTRRWGAVMSKPNHSSTSLRHLAISTYKLSSLSLYWGWCLDSPRKTEVDAWTYPEKQKKLMLGIMPFRFQGFLSSSKWKPRCDWFVL